MTDIQRQLLDQLADIARQIEAHRTAVWMLEQEQLRVRERLVRSGWTPPEPKP